MGDGRAVPVNRIARPGAGQIPAHGGGEAAVAVCLEAMRAKS